jgi:hypothetical protein
MKAYSPRTNPHRQFSICPRRKNKLHHHTDRKDGGLEKGIVAENVCVMKNNE